MRSEASDAAARVARIFLLATLVGLCSLSSTHAVPPPSPSFINTWLVLGTFENGTRDEGFTKDWIGEKVVAPGNGKASGGKKWTYFDDRLFSRNYDDYQDLYSYFSIKRRESSANKVVYAHTYVFSENDQRARLNIGADALCAAWVNGEKVDGLTGVSLERDSAKASVGLIKGWNRILLKIANRENGRFGFYARLSRTNDLPLDGLTYSADGAAGALKIDSGAMLDCGPGSMPTGWREWPYVGASPDQELLKSITEGDSPLDRFIQNPAHIMQASDFSFEGSGGAPPYVWNLAGGELPPGLSLLTSGEMVGKISAQAALKTYAFTVYVSDATGAAARKEFSIEVRERPNKWYEELRLVGLSHAPARLSPAIAEDYALLSKRQGYQLIMPISWNNGDAKFQFPSAFKADKTDPDHIAPIKDALEKHGINFGMYMGNLQDAPKVYPFSSNQQGLMVEDAIRKYHPKALWFDWLGFNGEGYDALYSMIRTLDPNIVIVLNGFLRGSQGDWDEICFEGWGAWGPKKMWSIWPVDIPWPKKNAPESWRFLPTNDGLAAIKGEVDWQEYLRVQISLIGEGFVANIDDSPTLSADDKVLTNLGDSYLMQKHREMADWASPKDVPPLYPSYTGVDPGLLAKDSWGYSVMNRERNKIYLHIMKNSRGKTGLPAEKSLTVLPVNGVVKAVTWMNRNIPLEFSQRNTSTDRSVTVELGNLVADPIDTILQIDLESPLPSESKGAGVTTPTDGNLALHRPAELLGPDGVTGAAPSSGQYAKSGVDGDLETSAAAAGFYSWIYQVDLGQVYRLQKIVVHFSEASFATRFKVESSVDKKNWRVLQSVEADKGGSHLIEVSKGDGRWIRVNSLKPDGPGQRGGQGSITELEVFGAP